ncbi:MAG: hypothetical protein HWE25_02935 [Alphaproteobacteria bacterium]|nr:hypothetical protein [Alphaproteobacteria bacterium]
MVSVGVQSTETVSSQLIMLVLGGAAFITAIDETFKNIIPYFPRGIALEMHDDFLIISSGNGPRHIPRSAVRGCKEPKSVRIVGRRGGRVEVSVNDEYKIRHWTGFKVNPSFHGMSVEGEDAVTMVRAIRDWRRSGRKAK